jgi:hypothetical protein
MNTWLDLIIPIPFLIAGLIIYYRRKNMSYQELQDEIKQIQSIPDDEPWTPSACANIGCAGGFGVFAHDDDD